MKGKTSANEKLFLGKVTEHNDYPKLGIISACPEIPGLGVLENTHQSNMGGGGCYELKREKRGLSTQGERHIPKLTLLN